MSTRAAKISKTGGLTTGWCAHFVGMTVTQLLTDPLARETLLLSGSEVASVRTKPGKWHDVEPDYVIQPGDQIELRQSFHQLGIGNVYTEAEFKDVFKISDQVYEDLKADGLPIQQMSDGSIRLIETELDQFFRTRRGEQTSMTSPLPTQQPVERERLQVDIDNQRVVFDGQCYPVSESAARMFAVLLESPGAIISSSDMIAKQPLLEGVRIDRQINRLPVPLAALIERHRGRDGKTYAASKPKSVGPASSAVPETSTPAASRKASGRVAQDLLATLRRVARIAEELQEWAEKHKNRSERQYVASRAQELLKLVQSVKPNDPAAQKSDGVEE